MKTIKFIRILSFLLVLPIMWSCKKDKDPVPTQTDPPEPTLRQATFQALVTGDFEEIVEFTFDGTTTETSLLGTYKSVENEFSLYALRTEGTNIFGINIRAEMNSLSVESHGLNNFNWGNTTYENTALSTGNFQVQTGTIVITSVEDVPAGLYGFLSGKYIAGTFSMSLANSNSQNVSITGSFTDVGVIFEN